MMAELEEIDKVVAEGPWRPDWESLTTHEIPEWFHDAKFGIFIHWGLYSVQGGEWKGKDYGKEQGGASAEWVMNSANIPKEEYRSTLAPRFNPTEFDPDQWCRAAVSAGFKYLLVVTKHHDGYTLWNSKYTDYDVGISPSQRDYVAELSEECRRQGLLFGTYYSILDWYHPHYPIDLIKGKRVKKEDAEIDQYIPVMKG